MESLRAPQRLRFGLTLAACLLFLAGGWRLWSGSANPLRFSTLRELPFERVAGQLAQLSLADFAKTKLASVGPDTAQLDLIAPRPSGVTDRLLLFHSETGVTLDHTLTLQKQGYTATRLVLLPEGVCESFSRGTTQLYRLSYYLSADFLIGDYELLSQALLTRRLGGERKARWLARLELHSERDCRTDAALAARSRDLNGVLRPYFARADASL